MQERPKIKLEFTYSDLVLEVLGWFTIALLWILTILNYTSLPESIPTHFNASGQVDDYGNKGSILLLPAVGTIIFAVILLLTRIPHIFNYPVTITEENAERQYRNAARMMRYMKFVVVFTFLIIQYRTIETAEGIAKGLGIWFMPVALGITFVPLALFIGRAVRAN
jgi:uncharacterized membrane protein